MSNRDMRQTNNVLGLTAGLLCLLVFVSSFVWFNQTVSAANSTPKQKRTPTKAVRTRIDARIKVIRENYTPSTLKGPFWTPNDFPHHSEPDDNIVPFHETAADLKMYPLNEWLPTQQRDLNPSVRFYTASFFPRPPDWVSDGMHGGMLDIRGPVMQNSDGIKSYSVWASLTLLVRQRNLTDKPWTSEINLMGIPESVTFSDNTPGIWIRKITPEDRASIQPKLRQKLFRLTPDDLIIEAELRASYPRADGKLDSSGIPKPGDLDPKASQYYQDVLKRIVENLNPKKISLPRPKVINIKNCEMDPYWVEFKYGDRVTFKNLDSKKHTLYGYNGNDDMTPPFKITVPAKGEVEYEAASITPQMWGSMWCDRKMGPHIPLMIPAPSAGEYFRQPELPITHNELRIKKCRPYPYFLRVEEDQPITIRNLDNKPHHLTYDVMRPPPTWMSTSASGQRAEVESITIDLLAKGSVTTTFEKISSGIAEEQLFSCDRTNKIPILIADPKYEYGGSGM